MHPQQGSPYFRPPRRPPPNYAARRVVAAVGALIVLWILLKLLGALFGGGGGAGDEQPVAAELDTSTTTTTLVAPPACAVADEPTIFGRPEDWKRTILDPTHALDDLYQPPDLVSASTANYAAEFRIRELMAEDLNLMRNAILAQGIPEVGLLAAYRSVDDQRVLFDKRVAELGQAAAEEGTARPGHSEHHLGTTIDVRLIGERDVDESFGATTTGRWLAENSWRYGFVLSYPEAKTDVTCYKYEPWHFRYIGIDLAGRVHESGLTLREYLWHWELTGSEPVDPPATSVPVASTEPIESEATGN